MKRLHNHQSLSLTRNRKGWIGAIALGLTVSLASACNQVTPTAQQDDQGTVTTEDVAGTETGDAVVGQLVTIRSGVVDVIDDNSFVMESTDGDRILIITSEAGGFTLPEEDVPLQVTGRLEIFDSASAQQYGVADLDPALYEDYDQQPAVIAQNIALAPRPQDLWNAPDEYFEETLAVEGDLRPLEGADNAFALFEEGWVSDTGVLVVGVDEAVNVANLEQGENIVVTGQARPADANLLREANFGWDDNQIQEFLSRYQNRPVIVVEEVYPSAVPPHPSV
ncbi:hypothetical protein [Leptolyngbya sp. KIOST-1]|uniref:hypothetical protein n=1 Tax=Leptolyngbya sp. KIOST-1 TaxID=1229172 RepID=UPI0012DFFEF9|nr:hypothetical protein [Leptolyngbya sp. KIOST-1]